MNIAKYAYTQNDVVSPKKKKRKKVRRESGQKTPYETSERSQGDNRVLTTFEMNWDDEEVSIDIPKIHQSFAISSCTKP